jgi:arginine repressor
VLGTLAGDDTVFVAPASARGGQALARRLRKLLGIG